MIIMIIITVNENLKIEEKKIHNSIFRAQLRFLTTARSAKPANAEWKALEKRVVDQNCNVLAGDERPEKEEDLAFIPGGGIASKFFKAR